MDARCVRAIANGATCMRSIFPLLNFFVLLLMWIWGTRQVAKLEASVDELKRLVEKGQSAEHSEGPA